MKKIHYVLSAILLMFHATVAFSDTVQNPDEFIFNIHSIQIQQDTGELTVEGSLAAGSFATYTDVLLSLNSSLGSVGDCVVEEIPGSAPTADAPEGVSGSVTCTATVAQAADSEDHQKGKFVAIERFQIVAQSDTDDMYFLYRRDLAYSGLVTGEQRSDFMQALGAPVLESFTVTKTATTPEPEPEPDPIGPPGRPNAAFMLMILNEQAGEHARAALTRVLG